MSIDTQLQYGLLGRVGSFWGEQTTEDTEDKARTFVYRSASVELLQTLDMAAQGLAGSAEHAVGKELVVNFEADQVLYVGPDIFNKWQSELQVSGNNISVVRYDKPRLEAVMALRENVNFLIGDGNRFLVYETGDPNTITPLETTYYVPIDFDISPMIILDEKSERTFVMGIDFVVGDGYLMFKESPTKLFSNGRMILASYTCRAENYRDFTLKQDHDTSRGYWIQELYRHAQSAYHFEKGLAQYSGLTVLRQESRVMSVQEIFGGYRYILEGEGLMDVRYPHTPLILGEIYPRGFIIDDNFRVFQKQPDEGTSWWVTAVADKKASLDGILPGKGCFVSSNSISVDYVDTHVSGKVHARIHYEGDGTTKEKAWEVLKQQESVDGVFLSDYLGITPATPAKQINFMQYLADFYGDKLLIIRLGSYTGNVEQLRRIKQFIERERPIGSVTLTLEN